MERRTPPSVLGAKPASLTFTGEQASGRAPQTVTIVARWWLAGYFDLEKPATVTVSGTGCVAVSPQTLKFASPRNDQRGFAWDDDDAAAATITVTPAGPAPANCTITVQHTDDPDSSDNGKHSVAIPVTVGGSPTPAP